MDNEHILALRETCDSRWHSVRCFDHQMSHNHPNIDPTLVKIDGRNDSLNDNCVKTVCSTSPGTRGLPDFKLNGELGNS